MQFQTYKTATSSCWFDDIKTQRNVVARQSLAPVSCSGKSSSFSLVVILRLFLTGYRYREKAILTIRSTASFDFGTKSFRSAIPTINTVITSVCFHKAMKLVAVVNTSYCIPTNATNCHYLFFRILSSISYVQS